MNFKKIILGVCLVLLSCKESGNEPYKDVSNEELVNTIIDRHALPQQENFVKEAEVLKEVSKEFLTNSTEANLVVLQEKWKILAKSWSRSFSFNIGPLRKSKYYLHKIAFWPVNKQGMEDFIGGSTEITLVDFKKRQSTTTGILSLGYLLHTDTSSANNIGTDKIVLAFKNSVNRRKMLGFVIDKILKDAKDLNKDWIDYAKELKNNKAKQGTIESSFSLLFNGLNNVIHFAWETKLSKPSGYGSSKHINPKKVEAPYSKYSLELIKENLRYTKEVFFSTKGASIEKRIKFITKNTILTDKVKSQYEVVENAINAFDHSLYDSLTDDFEKIKNLEEELKKLQVLFKVDISSALSLVNTGTDGDGD